MSSERALSDYHPTIEGWLNDFIYTMDLEPEVGNRSGDEPPGVKIIFDGYGYNDETDEQDDKNSLSFAIFVHKDSLCGEYPEHESSLWENKYRPEEEVCIHTCYELDSKTIHINGFEDSDTELDHEFVYKLIRDLELSNYKYD